jgi:hypothetical protein
LQQEMKSNSDTRALIASLIKRSDEFWYRYTLRKELYSKKLSPLEIEDIIKMSMKTAEGIKVDILGNKGSLDILEYFEVFGLKLKRVEGEVIKEYLFMALYNEGSRVVTLNEDVIKLVKDFVEVNKLQDLIDIEHIEKIVLMHELFHHIEVERPSIYTRSKMLDRKLFGFFDYKRGINSASEIGAIHFSKLMTGLGYSPCIYEVLLLLSVGNYDAALKLTSE